MPRQKRYTQFHSCHHVKLRGNAGQSIFLDDSDRVRFCLMLQKTSEEYHFAIHAFCYMNNHVHLILEPTILSLSKGVQAFVGRYAQYFNRRHKQRGHLFQDRFRSILIGDDDYLIRVVRYIHLNPVRAKLAKEPQHYIWSSYCTYLALNDITWLTQTRVLKKFSDTPLIARQAIARHSSKKTDAELDIRIVRESHQIGALGNGDFLKNFIPFSTKKTKVQFIDLITAAKAEFQFNSDEISSSGREKRLVDIRSALALAVQQIPGLHLQQLAGFLNRDVSSLSRLVIRARQSRDISQQVDKLLKQLDQ